MLSSHTCKLKWVQRWICKFKGGTGKWESLKIAQKAEYVQRICSRSGREITAEKSSLYKFVQCRLYGRKAVTFTKLCMPWAVIHIQSLQRIHETCMSMRKEPEGWMRNEFTRKVRDTEDSTQQIQLVHVSAHLFRELCWY